MSEFWWILLPVVFVVVASAIAIVVARRRAQSGISNKDFAWARKEFHLRREWLEAHFLKLASDSGKPRGLAWAECDFQDGVAFARERHTGHLRALVGVTISFEALEGGGMEDNPNVGNLRAATAIFRFDGIEWTTDGRAIFNLNPAEAIKYYENELEFVE